MNKSYPPPTSDPFVDSCFQLDFEELEEPRNWRQMEDLANIPPLATGGRYQEALTIIEEGLARYPDYDFLYGWRGFIQAKLGRREEERKTYLEGIRKSRSKISLCDHLGQWEFDHRHLAEAVRWWIRACVIQLSQDKLEYAHPFLLLAYIAKGLGLPACQSALFKQCDQIDYVRLNAAGESQCSRLVSSQGEASIKRAIALLCEFYLGVPSEKPAEGQATPQPTAASEEPSPSPKPQQAQCDICNAVVPESGGYQLTTTQVVRSPRFWRDYYQRHQGEFAAMGMPSYDALLRSPARTTVAEQIARDATPWLVCEKCIHHFDVNREQARAYAWQWWESGRTFSPPGTGPASLSKVRMEEKIVTPPREVKEIPKAEAPPPRGVPRWSPGVALLNLTGLGLGYLYMQRWLRWLIHFLLTGGLIAAAFLTNASHFPLLWMVVFGLWLLWMVFDGWRQARRLVQAAPVGTVGRPWLPIVLTVLIIGLEAAGFWGYRTLGYREFVKGQAAYQLGDYQLTHQYLDRVVSLYALSFAPYVTLAEEYLADCEALQEQQQARLAAQAQESMTRVPQPTHTSSPTCTPTASPTSTPTPLPTAKPTIASTPTPTRTPAPTPTPPPASVSTPAPPALTPVVPTPTKEAVLTGKLVYTVYNTDFKYLETVVVTVDGKYVLSVPNVIQPAFGPNGKWLVFRSLDPGGIGVMNLDTGARQLLTQIAQDSHPSFDSNSHNIVFSRDDLLYLVDVASQPTVHEVGNLAVMEVGAAAGRFPDWCPLDHKTPGIVYSGFAGGGRFGLMLTTPTYDVHYTITQEPYDLMPTWSPDCTQIAFAREEGGNWDIYVINPDGSGRSRLTSDGAIEFAPVWSPAGDLIAFLSNRDGSWAIWAMDPDGQNARKLIEMEDRIHIFQDPLEQCIDWAP